MKISTKGRYALTVMIELARNYEKNEYLTLNEIAKKDNLSLKYLERIISSLKKEDFFLTLRGEKGGYKLKYEPSKYSVAKIIRAAEEKMDIAPCLDKICNRSASCSMYKLWNGLDNVINDYLESKTLKDLL